MALSRIASTNCWDIYASAADVDTTEDDPSGNGRLATGLRCATAATVMVRRDSLTDTPKQVDLAGGEELLITFRALEATGSTWTNLMILWDSAARE